MKMVQYVKSLFVNKDLTNKKEEKNIDTDLQIEELDEYESPAQFSHENFPPPVIGTLKVINFAGENKPNILLMDDFPAMIDLLSNELKRIPKQEVFKNFNIYSAMGEFAAFQVMKYLSENEGFYFDIAILDITLGGIIRGVELDGVDVAISLKKANQKCAIKFITGHTLNQRNPEIFKFSQKFKEYTKLDIDEKIEIEDFNGIKHTIYKHVIGKNDNRIILMNHLIETFLKTKG